MSMLGDEGFLTLTLRMKVSPEPEIIELLKRYKTALNYAIRWIIENSAKTKRGYKVPSLSKVHEALYERLRSMGFPSRIAIDCYREALAIAKSYLGNGANGKIPRVKSLRIWLTHRAGYRIKNEYIEIIGGYRLRIIGWDKRYDGYENREARLVYRDGKMFLFITKRIPKPKTIEPKGIIAVDINEKHIYIGNKLFIDRIETAIDRAIHYKKLAENLQKKYSSSRYNAWLRRKGVLNRIRYFHKKAKNIIEDWVKKTALTIVLRAKKNGYAVAREDLNNLIESLRKLPKNHRVRMIILSYRKLLYWIDWQAQKHGVMIIAVNPKNTSLECPKCGSKMVENGYRRMKCTVCRFEADRDVVAVLNIEKKALIQMGGFLTTPTAPQMTDVIPNRCGELMSPLKGTLAL